MYLAWFDDNPKHDQRRKLADGAAAYQDRFGYPPNVALVHPEEVAEAPGLLVRAEGYIRRNNIWFGFEPFAAT